MVEHEQAKGQTRLRITDAPFGVRTEIDGVEMPYVRAVDFHVDVDSGAVVTLDMLAQRPMEIDVSAKVVINLHVPEGCEILDITGHAAGTRKIVVTPQAWPRA